MKIYLNRILITLLIVFSACIYSFAETDADILTCLHDKVDRKRMFSRFKSYTRANEIKLCTTFTDALSLLNTIYNFGNRNNSKNNVNLVIEYEKYKMGIK